MATGRVRGGLTKNPPRPKMLMGENPHPWVETCTRTRRVSGRFRVPVGFDSASAIECPRVSGRVSGARGFWGGFRVPAGFGAGFGCQRALGPKIVVHGLYTGAQGGPRVRIETRTYACCHPRSGMGASMGVNLDPHPTGSKLTGDSPRGCRLPSLQACGCGQGARGGDLASDKMMTES
jgi:hypothetical protein